VTVKLYIIKKKVSVNFFPTVTLDMLFFFSSQQFLLRTFNVTSLKMMKKLVAMSDAHRRYWIK